MKPQSSIGLLQLLRERLFTAGISDILDREGCRRQFLPQPIKPLHPAHRVFGRALPVRIGDGTGPQSRPFGHYGIL